ncbi:MAG: hypothetical protein GY856_16410 [bacterium]|nr:hypothetical protein [bacterium]
MSDITDLGGLAAQLDALQGSGNPTVLGGRAPVWAYWAAMHRVHDSHPTALIGVWDARSRAAIFVTGPDAPWMERSDLFRKQPFKE